MKKILFGFVVAAITCTLGITRAAETGIGNTGAATVAAAGGDALLYVHLRNPQELLTKVNALVRQVNPNFNALETLQLGQAFHNPALEGVDLTQPITVVLLNTKKYPGTQAGLATLVVTDGERFVNAIGAGAKGSAFALNAATAGQPVREFSRTMTKTDRDAYDRAIAAGQNADISDFQKKVTEAFFVGIRGKQVVVGPSKAMVEKALTPLAQVPVQILSADIVATVRMDAVFSAYDAEIKAARTQLEGAMMMMGGPQAQQGKVLAELFQLMQDESKSAQTIELAGNLSEGNLELSFAFAPKANTDLAKFLTAQAKPTPELLKFAPANAAIATSFTLRATPDTNTWTDRLLKIMLKAQGYDTTQSAEMLKFAQDNLANWGGEAAVYVMTPADGSKGINAIFLQKANDSAKARELMERGVKLQAQAPKQAGIDQTHSFQKDAAKIGSTSLDLYTVTNKFADPQQAQMLADMGLNEIKMFYTYPPKFVVGGFGESSFGAIEKTLAALKANQPQGLTDAPEFQTATRGFPKDANGVFFISFERYLQILANIMPGDFAQQVGFASMMFAGSGINISGYAALHPENGQAQLRIPLKKILDTVQKVQQQFQGGPPPARL